MGKAASYIQRRAKMLRQIFFNPMCLLTPNGDQKRHGTKTRLWNERLTLLKATTTHGFYWCCCWICVFWLLPNQSSRLYSHTSLQHSFLQPHTFFRGEFSATSATCHNPVHRAGTNSIAKVTFCLVCTVLCRLKWSSKRPVSYTHLTLPTTPYV